jgi:hypothetical protein
VWITQLVRGGGGDRCLWVLLPRGKFKGLFFRKVAYIIKRKRKYLRSLLILDVGYVLNSKKSESFYLCMDIEMNHLFKWELVIFF